MSRQMKDIRNTEASLTRCEDNMANDLPRDAMIPSTLIGAPLSYTICELGPGLEIHNLPIPCPQETRQETCPMEEG